MKDKVKIGLLLTAFLVVCLVIQYFFNYAIDLVILFFSLIAVKEFKRLQIKSGNPTFKFVPEITCFLVFVASFVGFLCGFSGVTIMLIVFGIIVVVYLALLLIAMYGLKDDIQKDVFRLSTNMTVNEFAFFKTNNTLTTMVYPTLLMFFMYLINHINQLGFGSFNQHTEGVPIALFAFVLLFMICCLSDTFAMIFGRLIKGKKLCPKISPNKTIAGALFGLLGGILGAVISYYIFFFIFRSVFSTIAVWKFIVIGLIGSAISQAGDLFESFFKRKANVKDAGEIFRSHGGALDRLDSIIFNAPFVFACLLFIF